MRSLRLIVLLFISILIFGGGQALAASPSCGDIVTKSTVLEQDLVQCPSDGLVVGANNIKIDLNAHSITGAHAVGSAGIRNPGYDNVRIVDGDFVGLDISDFEFGVLLQGARANRVRGVFVAGDSYGIVLFDSHENRVEANNARSSGSVAQCDVRTETGIALFGSDRNRIRANVAELSDFGIVLIESDDNSVEHNSASPAGSDGNACDGIALVDSAGTLVRDNVASNNARDGIRILPGSTDTLIQGNVAFLNGDDGIDAQDPATTISRNSASRNLDLGIEAVEGITDGGGNRAEGNGNPAQCVNVACA
jgi:parallel beta-helix repeat protein